MDHRPFQFKIRYLMFANACVAIWLAIYFGLSRLMFGGGWQRACAFNATLATGMFFLPVGLLLAPAGLERQRLKRAYWAFCQTLCVGAGIMIGAVGFAQGAPFPSSFSLFSVAMIVASAVVLLTHVPLWWRWAFDSPPCPACGRRSLFTPIHLQRKR